MFTAYKSVTKTHIKKCQHTIMHLHFVDIGAKFQPYSVDAHRVETLCLQHTLDRLSLILPKLGLFRLSTLPYYVTPMKLDSPSSLKLRALERNF